MYYRDNYGEVSVILSGIFYASESKISDVLAGLHTFIAVLSLAVLVVTVIHFAHCCNDVIVLLSIHKPRDDV